jgi:MSHA biogenesis protein MshJ
VTAVTLVDRLRGAGERVDRMSLRERVLVFVVGVALLYVAWQTLLMDPIAARGRAAQHRLEESRARLEKIDAAGAAGDPRVQTLERRRALQDRLSTLDARLREAAGGFVPPDRMADVLRDVLASQRGLRLVSIRNLPVVDLGITSPAAAPATATPDAAPAESGPFVHPVEIVVEGDFASIVAYLRAVEGLAWQVQWRRLDLAAGDYPKNRVRIELGTLGLTRAWLSV